MHGNDGHGCTPSPNSWGSSSLLPVAEGEDVGLGTRAKYILVATVAIPRLPREAPDDEGGQELDGEDGEPLPIEEDDDDEHPKPDDDQVQRLNGAWEDYIKSLGEPVGVQNITRLWGSTCSGYTRQIESVLFCRDPFSPSADDLDDIKL